MNVDVSNINNLAEQLLSLPPSSRAFLAEKLVVSIDNYADPEIEAAWRKEIAWRIQEYEEGKVHGISSEEVFREARKRIDDETRYQAEMRERALRNKVSELAAAREEGIEEGREEGREEGLKQGEIIGQIRLLQEMLKHLICSEKDLVQKSIEELNKMLQELKAELKS